MKVKTRIGIIGGGIAGLVAGYELSKAGVHVTLLERERRMGGLASSFALEPGQAIEKYYHFICKPDKSYFEVMRELGLTSCLRWATTEMGLFYKGRLHTIGDPLNLLIFPHLSIGDKIRFAWVTAITKFSNSASWKAIENVEAREWLIRQYGQRAYNMLYAPLLELKFREYAPKISAAWMWARLHRLGNSRTFTQRERLGYLEGGSQTYIDALEQALRERDAELCASTAVERIIIEGDRAIGIQREGELLRFDYVLSTVPIPHARELLADASGPYFDNLRQLEYISVMTMVMRLRHRFSKYFWINISDPEIALPGIVEYTNLNSSLQLDGDAILYLPQYLFTSHSLYTMDDEELFSFYCGYLRKINPRFEAEWVRDYWVHRNHFAQPICERNFSKRIPPIQTPVENLYLTDSYQVHPGDRSISDSTHLGKKVARLILMKQELGAHKRITSGICHSERSEESR